MLFKETGTDKVKKHSSAGRNEELYARYINAHIKKDLQIIIGELKMGESVHYANDTLFYLHDVIVHCLSQTGPAQLYFATYAIKEFQARMFSKMKAENLITAIHALVDYRNEQLDAGAMQILKKCCDSLGFERTHSKLIVIKNKEWGISIVTSANLTNNTRLDVGVITCHQKIAEERILWIQKHTKHEKSKQKGN